MINLGFFRRYFVNRAPEQAIHLRLNQGRQSLRFIMAQDSSCKWQLVRQRTVYWQTRSTVVYRNKNTLCLYTSVEVETLVTLHFHFHYQWPTMQWSKQHKRQWLAWIRNLAVSDKLYKKYSICPDIRLDCECTVHCSLWSSPLDWKLGTCNICQQSMPLLIFCLKSFIT